MDSKQKEIIRRVVEEQLLLIEEDKSSMLKKIPGLKKEQITALLDLFKKYNNLEKEVDWNNFKRLTWENDFAPLFEQGSMGNEFKKLKKNKDYVKVIDKALDKIPGLLGVYMPLNHKAANILAKKAGGNKASWCIGYDGDDGYWYCYSYGIEDNANYSGDGYNSVFMIIITSTNKWAVQVQTDNNNDIIIWDADDKSHGDDNELVPNVNVQRLVKTNSRLITDVREELDSRGEDDERLDELREEQEYKYCRELSIGDTAMLDSEWIETEHGGEVEARITSIDCDDDTVDVEYVDTESRSRPFEDLYYEGNEIQVIENFIDDDDLISSLEALEEHFKFDNGHWNHNPAELKDDLSFEDTVEVADELSFGIEFDEEDEQPEYLAKFAEEIESWFEMYQDEINAFFNARNYLDDIKQPFVEFRSRFSPINVTDTIQIDSKYGADGEITYIDEDEYEFMDYDVEHEKSGIPAYVMSGDY